MAALWHLWRLQPLIVQVSGAIVLLAVTGCFAGLFMQVGESDHRHLARRYQRMRREQDAREQRRNLDRASRLPYPIHSTTKYQPFPDIWQSRERQS